jgi:hypothetical protein
MSAKGPATAFEDTDRRTLNGYHVDAAMLSIAVGLLILGG